MADIDVSLNGGAAKLCNYCDTRINEQKLKKQLSLLRELEPAHFYICEDCVRVVDDRCNRCNGAVYVPQNATEIPSLCPACRNDIIQQIGQDPGWDGYTAE